MTSSREVSWKISIKVLKLKTSGQIARAKFSYISQIEFIVVLLPVDFIVFKTDQNRSIDPAIIRYVKGQPVPFTRLF